MNKKLGKINNLIFYIGLIVAVYGLYRSYINTKGLPPGVCPIENSRPILFIAIGLLILSTVLSYIQDIQNKKIE